MNNFLQRFKVGAVDALGRWSLETPNAIVLLLSDSRLELVSSMSGNCAVRLTHLLLGARREFNL